jgi:hypothetical protein
MENGPAPALLVGYVPHRFDGSPSKTGSLKMSEPRPEPAWLASASAASA